jgi:DNA ligase-1
MKFKELAEYLYKLETTASRNDMTEILADLFNKTSASEIDKVIYLLLGGVAPRYKEVVFNMADKMMVRAIAKAYDRDTAEVLKLYKEKGDIGDVAFELSESKGNGIELDLVFELLKGVADSGGAGSQEQKIQRMAEILSQLDKLSTKYVARIPVGKLRLGFSDKTMLDALSWMEKGDKSGKSQLEFVYQVLPDIGLLAKEVKAKGIKEATLHAKPQVGVPVSPMLAQRLKDPTEMIKKMERVGVEPKLDGLRISIHFKRSKFVKAYTRNMNEVSWMFPELKEIDPYILATDVILDSEAVGVDEIRKSLANFQSTMTRRRKHEVAEYAGKIPIKFYVFDLLLKDGKNLMKEDYLTRKKELESTVKKGKFLELVDYVVTDSPQVINSANLDKRKAGFEGIMIKKVDSAYIPGRTGWRWVKMKEGVGSSAKLADTVDCVIMGYTQGRGKRASFGMGQFLAGVRMGEKIVTVTKVGTGLTDEQFRELSKRLNGIVIGEKPSIYEVQKDYIPDFWVTPEVIVELAGDDITKSPKHTGGFAIRFPRLVRFRDDRSVSDTSTIEEVEDLYKLQLG